MIISVLDYLDSSTLESPDSLAFADQRSRVTYFELSDLSRKIGTCIARNTGGVIRRPVVVFVDRTIETIISFMGVVRSGNFYVPIDIQMPVARIDLILETLQPLAAIVRQSESDFASRLTFKMTLISFEDALLNQTDEPLLEKIRNSLVDTDPVYATFTSGSTGVPKGVVTCHRSVIDLTEALAETFRFQKENNFGNQNPFYFDASIKDIYSTLKCGATMYIIPKSCFTFPVRLIEFLNSNRIDTILWSAAAIGLIANTHAFDETKPDFLKQVFFSGEVMHNKILNYWRRNLPETMYVNLYGPTEITSVCTYYKVSREFEDDEVLPIGVPFRNTGIILLNNDNKPVRENEIGEICVRGCCLALGYYNNPEKTREAFCQNPLNENYPELIYRTGDLAKYDAAGQIIFLSRKDNQVKHMGHRVELGDIEILVNSLDRINASICFYDHDKQKIVLIYEGADVDSKYIINETREILPKYMYPNILIRLNELPCNVNGKIDRSLLKKRYEENQLS
jgi:D-alanine--poly(phosphoribitol) ligase subunit 1